MQTETEATQDQSALIFTFGDPEPVIEDGLEDILQTFWHIDGEYYLPPVSFDLLNKIFNKNPALQSAIHARKRSFISTYKPNKYISRKVMERAFIDFDIFGNAFLRIRLGGLRNLRRLEHLPTRPTRIGEKKIYQLRDFDDPLEFDKEEIIHIDEYNPSSSIYGMPEHVAIIGQAALATESVKFRTKYFVNGAHMGYLLHIHDPKFTKEEQGKVQEQLKAKKGAGNFNSMLIVTRTQGKDGENKVELKPVGEITSKDEFRNIMELTTAQVLMTKRVPLAMMAVMPGKANFGSQKDAVNNYAVNEIAQIQADFAEMLNPHLPPDGQVEFSDFRDLIASKTESAQAVS